jgi:hypothetical protein
MVENFQFVREISGAACHSSGGSAGGHAFARVFSVQSVMSHSVEKWGMRLREPVAGSANGVSLAARKRRWCSPPATSGGAGCGRFTGDTKLRLDRASSTIAPADDASLAEDGDLFGHGGVRVTKAAGEFADRERFLKEFLKNVFCA